MDAQTHENLLAALHGEAFAYAKYMLYAKHARASGHPQLADLFEQTARTELLEHFAEEAQLAGLVGSDAENLRDAIGGEAYEIETMYREFAEQAAAVGEKDVAERFNEVRGDEMSHRAVFSEALRHFEAPTASNPS